MAQLCSSTQIPNLYIVSIGVGRGSRTGVGDALYFSEFSFTPVLVPVIPVGEGVGGLHEIVCLGGARFQEVFLLGGFEFLLVLGEFKFLVSALCHEVFGG